MIKSECYAYRRIEETPAPPTLCVLQLYMSDGSSRPITCPGRVIMTPRTACVGLDAGEDDLTAQNVVICDLVHVTRLGPMNGQKRKRSTEPKR